MVAAPIVGALKPEHIDDAVASLSISLTDEEAARLEAPYTPRLDHQGRSDPAMLRRAAETATGHSVSHLPGPWTEQGDMNLARSGYLRVHLRGLVCFLHFTA